MDKWTKLYNKWLLRSTTAEERFQLEKKGLDDEFISDALEGIDLYQETGHKDIPYRLQQSLNQRINRKRKIIRFWPYGIAASVILLAIAGMIFYQAPPGSNIDLSHIDSTVESTRDNIALNTKESNHAQQPESLAKKTASISADIANETIDIERQSKKQTSANGPSTETSNQTLKSKTTKTKSNSVVARAQNDASIDNIIKPEHPIELASNSYGRENMAEVSEFNDPDVAAAESAADEPMALTRENTAMIVADDHDGSTNSMLSKRTAQVDKTHLTPQVSIQDSLKTKPLIGWKAFDMIVADHMPEKNWLFMRGINEGQTSTMILGVSGSKDYQIIDAGLMPVENIVKIMQATGPWHTLSSIDTIKYQYQIFARSQ